MYISLLSRLKLSFAGLSFSGVFGCSFFGLFGGAFNCVRAEKRFCVYGREKERDDSGVGGPNGFLFFRAHQTIPKKSERGEFEIVKNQGQRGVSKHFCVFRPKRS